MDQDRFITEMENLGYSEAAILSAWKKLRPIIEDVLDAPSRVATSEQLREILTISSILGYNRQLRGDWTLLEGDHLLVPRLIHRFIAGKPADPHIRVQAWLSVEGEDEPVGVVLDVEPSAFLALPVAVS